MKIGFQGAVGAYSETAAQRAWPGSETVAFDRFEDVFEAVASGRTSHGILPVENSIGGSIHRNYDLLLEHDLPIVAETELPVVHNLLALPGTSIQAVRRVFSHPQALAQCEMFLHTLPGIEIVATYDTAGSARMIKEGNLTDTAAIASLRAAEVFGLEHPAGGDSGLRRQHHPLPPHRPRRQAARDPRQDDPGVCAAQRTGGALQGAERLRAARHRHDQARIASGARAAVGVRLLRRSLGRPGRAALRAGDRASRRVRALGQDARLLPPREAAGPRGREIGR